MNDTPVWLVNDLRWEIVLFPETGNENAVVDPFFRSNVTLPKVIVPVYPEIGDSVCVTGEDGFPWRALLTEVNYHTSGGLGT